MALDTYSDLKSTISSYLARTDLDSVIPDLIRLGEMRLRRDLRIRQMLVMAQANTVGGNGKLGLPSDFMEMRAIYLDTNPVQPLTYRTPNNFFNDILVTTSGRPKFYTVLATDFQFAPMPDTDYSVQMLYYARPPFLSDAKPTNVFLANTPDALLYASLGEAEPYLMNDARLQTWAALYDRAVASITESDEGSEYGGAPMQMTVA